MKITVIKSSPNTHGSSNLLADEFIRGAQENGHDRILLIIAEYTKVLAIFAEIISEDMR